MNSDLIQFAVMASAAVACGIISPFLVLKRMTMFANSLSHTSLLGVAIAYLAMTSLWGGGLLDLTTLFLGALIAAVLTAILTEGLHRLFRLTEDASTGLIFVTLFAIGVMLVTLFTKNTHLSVEAVLGNPDALQLSDLKFALPVAFVNLIAIVLFYRPFQLIAFDESFAKAAGVQCGLWRAVLIFLTALTCIASFRAVGALVVLTLLTAPYLTIRLFFNRLISILILTPIYALFLVILSIFLSRLMFEYFFPLSTAGILATLSGVFFMLAICIRSVFFKNNSYIVV